MDLEELAGLASRCRNPKEACMSALFQPFFLGGGIRIFNGGASACNSS
jgi:hypothetical protein